MVETPKFRWGYAPYWALAVSVSEEGGTPLINLSEADIPILLRSVAKK